MGKELEDLRENIYQTANSLDMLTILLDRTEKHYNALLEQEKELERKINNGK